MGMMHVRKPKNFVLEERLERYAAAIESEPEAVRGIWDLSCAVAGKPFERVYLDLGCGKGDGLVAMAAADASTLFVGADQEPVCIAYAAQKICEAGLKNAVVINRSADDLARVFAPGELAGISINFPTPQPKKRRARLRLVHVDKLLGYRALLAPGAALTFRSDSRPLWLYARTQFPAAGYTLLWESEDVRAEHPQIPLTEYEARTSAKGAVVYGICATPGPAPSEAQLQAGREAEQSLAAYLPEDLENIGYVPIGMEDTVVNMRNRKRKGKSKLPEN